MERQPRRLLSSRPARRGAPAVVLLAAAAAAALWCCRAPSATGGGTTWVVSKGQKGEQKRQRKRRKEASAFDFNLLKSDDHKDLVLEEQDSGSMRVSTNGGMMTGHWNTVLGDKELPEKGMAYWEVRIVKKPTDAWEYIGVAEPGSDVTVPLTRNRKGAGWFWGSTWSDSFMYTYLPMSPRFNKEAKLHGMQTAKWVNDKLFRKTKREIVMKQVENMWTGLDGTHVGTPGDHPPFENGMVVGVEADMDEGSLAFWADGKYMGKVMDTNGKTNFLKGKKLVPAISVYGRHTGMVKQHTVMEVVTGLKPPKEQPQL